MAGKARENGEGSIYPYRNGFAAYVWVDTPAGERKRKYVYGQSREIVHEKWIRLHAEAQKGPVATTAPKIAALASRWLAEVVKPNSAPLTYATAESHIRLYIVPGLGKVEMSGKKLTVRVVQQWLNKIAITCQCCAQGKDAGRGPLRQRCCAVGECCESYLSARSVSDIRATLRTLVSHAMVEELVDKNVVSLTKVPRVAGRARRRKKRRWTNAEAKQFLVSARTDDDPMYAGYVLVVLMALRKGEVLGLPVDCVDLLARELDISWQLQRVSNQLLHRETKTEASEDTLPIPAIAAAAIRLRLDQRARDRVEADVSWYESGLLMTTRHGTPIEPRNFLRSWDARCAKAGVPKITVHDGRRSCASLLVDLGVHPRVVMRILRHANMKITMEVYSEVSDESVREALDKLSEGFD